MRMVLYLLLLATQVTGAIAFARTAQGHRVAILEAEGAAPLTPTGAGIRAFGSAVAAALMVIGLFTSRWIGWDIGVMIMALFFLMEVRRLKKWRGWTKVAAYITSALVVFECLIDLLTRT
jgi:hypothetical protein